MANAPTKKPNAGKKNNKLVDQSTRARMLHRYLQTLTKEDPLHAVVKGIDPGHEFLEHLGWTDEVEDGEERWLDSWDRKGGAQTWLKTSFVRWRKTWVDEKKPAKQASEEPVAEGSTAAEAPAPVSLSAAGDAKALLPDAANTPVVEGDRTTQPHPATYPKINPSLLPTAPSPITSGDTTVVHPVTAEGSIVIPPAPVAASPLNSVSIVAPEQFALGSFTSAAAFPQSSTRSPLIPAGNTAVAGPIQPKKQFELWPSQSAASHQSSQGLTGSAVKMPSSWQSTPRPINATGEQHGCSAPQSRVTPDLVAGHQSSEGLAQSTAKVRHGMAGLSLYSDLDHGAGQAQVSQPLAESSREVSSLASAERQRFYDWYRNVYKRGKK